jgi:hypothetical protein
VVPRTGTIWEDLFRLAHDTLGHFGGEKSYRVLRDSYYWPNMQRDLELAYVPGCAPCQRNKSQSHKPKGPLHPLPVPDERGDRIAMDFIGPLPLDKGYDCILTITDALGSDIRLIPTTMKLTAEECAELFFTNWYCENGLPKAIVSDRDKLFVSKFWRAVCKLSGVKLKMSSAYHPETDGSSERTNKTVNQCIRYHVNRSQKGWVRALPLIRFQMLNTVNKSTGYSGFQLRFGKSPRLVPEWNTEEMVAENPELKEALLKVTDVLSRLRDDVNDARDNLLSAKFQQAFFANRKRGEEEKLKVGEKVLVDTSTRRHEYKSGKKGRVAKFMPRFDGPFTIVEAHPEISSYKVDIPGHPGGPQSFHTSRLKKHVENDDVLFPSRTMERPGPIVTKDGEEEWEIDKIIDDRKVGRGMQYLVRWTGHGDEDLRWLPRRELKDCAALDDWEGTGVEDSESDR